MTAKDADEPVIDANVGVSKLPLQLAELTIAEWPRSNRPSSTSESSASTSPPTAEASASTTSGRGAPALITANDGAADMEEVARDDVGREGAVKVNGDA